MLSVWTWIIDHTTVLSTVASAIAAIAVAAFTLVLVCIGRSADKNFRTVERAYVQMSHIGGLQFMSSGFVSLDMQIKNWGNTPAKIIRSTQDIDIRGASDSMPPTPVYDFSRNSQSGFLVTDAVMSWPEVFGGRKVAFADVSEGKVIVRVIGCVEYEDKFGGRHQARYARRYEHRLALAAALAGRPVAEANTLVFEMTPGYNDDISIPSA